MKLTSMTALEAARKLRRLALEVDEISALLNDDGAICETCGTTHYLFWIQKQLKDKTLGAAGRLREIADIFERRRLDPEFLGTNKPSKDIHGEEETPIPTSKQKLKPSSRRKP